jgi:N6-adenosine-specific RNA methylase IME4
MAHVWLWTTQRFLPAAFDCLEVWQMAYCCTFVWIKPGGMQAMGLPQFTTEFALYARTGPAALLDTTNLPTHFEAPRGAHSAKPDVFYDMVRRITAGRRLDMFNRRPIDGFEGWGFDAPTES